MPLRNECPRRFADAAELEWSRRSATCPRDESSARVAVACAVVRCRYRRASNAAS